MRTDKCTTKWGGGDPNLLPSAAMGKSSILISRSQGRLSGAFSSHSILTGISSLVRSLQSRLAGYSRSFLEHSICINAILIWTTLWLLAISAIECLHYCNEIKTMGTIRSSLNWNYPATHLFKKLIISLWMQKPWWIFWTISHVCCNWDTLNANDIPNASQWHQLEKWVYVTGHRTRRWRVVGPVDSTQVSSCM